MNIAVLQRGLSAVLLVALLFVALVSADAQQAPALGDLTTIPVDKEPQHHVLFANEAVRVIDARFPPGNMSLKHAHAADTVTITITSGKTDPEGLARIGRADYNKGGYSHIVPNPGTSELRFLDVELLTSGSIAPDPRPLPAHTLELENDKVRIYRVVLASGQSIAGHSHGHGWLAVVVKSDPKPDTRRGGNPILPGSFEWHAAGSKDALTNTGTVPLEIVELEPK